MGDIKGSSGGAGKSLSGAGKEVDGLGGSMVKSGKAASGLAGNLVKAGKASDDLADRLIKVGKGAKSGTTGVKGLGGETVKTNKFLDIFNKNLERGDKEAKQFAGGVGESSTGLIAMGVAASYAAGKLNEILSSAQGASVNFAKFRVEADILANTTLGLTARGLDEVRDSLGVTSKNFGQFASIVKQGAQTGVASIDELTEAGIKLREAYGGEQLDKLKEFVNLLNEIPALNPELKVNASFDQDSSNLLALAQKGKVEAFIELESAGLFGGQKTADDTEGKKLLEAQTNTAKKVDDVYNTLSKYYPTWGPAFTASAGAITQVATILGTGFAMVAAFKVFFGKGNKTQQAIEKAQLKTTDAVGKVEDAVRQSAASKLGSKGKTGRLKPRVSSRNAQTNKAALSRLRQSGLKPKATLGIQPAGEKGKIFKGFSDIFKKSKPKAADGSVASLLKKNTGSKTGKLFSKASSKLSGAATKLGMAGGIIKKAGNRSLLKAGGKTGVKLASKAAGAATGIGAAGLAFDLAGFALKEFSASLEESGNKTAAGAAKAAGSLLSMAGDVATFTAVGALIGGPFGAAIGAATGVVVGLASELGNVGDGMQSFARGLQQSENGAYKYSALVRAGGVGIEVLGKTASYVGGVFKAAGENLAYSASYVGGKLSDLGNWIIKSSAQLKKEEDQRKASVKAAKEQEAAMLVSRRFSMEMNRTVVALKKEQKTRHASMLAFQKQFKQIGNIVKDSNFALVRFQKEIANVELDVFAKSGASLGMWDAALNKSIASTTSEFETLKEGFSSKKKDIQEDPNLRANERKLALEALHSEEMKAANNFVSGMQAAMSKFLKTPDIINDALERQIAGIQLDLLFGSSLGGGIDEYSSGLEAATGGLDKLNERAGKAAEAIEKAAAQREAQVSEQKKSAVKSLELKSESKKGIDQNLAKEGKEISESGDEKALSDFLNRLEKLGKEREEAGDKAEDALKKNFSQIFGEMTSATAASSKKAQQVKEQKAVAEGSKGDQRNEELKKLEALEQELKNLRPSEELTKRFTDALNKADIKVVLDKSGNVDLEKTRSTKLNDKLAKDRAGFVDLKSKVGESKQGASSVRGIKENVKLASQDPAASTETFKLEEQKKLADEFAKKASEISSSISSANKLYESGALQGLIQQRMTIDNSLEQVKNIGDSTKFYAERTQNLFETLQETRKTTAGIDKANKKALKSQEDILNTQKEKLKVIIEEEGAESQAAKAQKNVVNAAGKIVGELKRATIQNEGKNIAAYNKYVESIVFPIEVLETELNKRFGSFALPKALKELGETKLDASKFSKDTEGAAFDAAASIIEAQDTIAKKSRKLLVDQNARYIKDVQKQIDASRGRGDEGTAKGLEEALAAVKVKQANELLKIDTQRRDVNLKALKDAQSLSLSRLNIEQSVVDAEENFLSSIGANFESVFNLQLKSLAIEKDKLDLAKKTLSEAKANGTTGKELVELEAAVKLQSIKLQTKALAKQRSTMEQILGSAFGELRDIGARKGTQSQFRLLGVEGSRRKTRAGNFAAGEAGTLQERENRNVTSGEGITIANRLTGKFGNTGDYNPNRRKKNQAEKGRKTTAAERANSRKRDKKDADASRKKSSNRDSKKQSGVGRRSVKAGGGAKDCCAKSLTVLERIRDILESIASFGAKSSESLEPKSKEAEVAKAKSDAKKAEVASTKAKPKEAKGSSKIDDKITAAKVTLAAMQKKFDKAYAAADKVNPQKHMSHYPADGNGTPAQKKKYADAMKNYMPLVKAENDAGRDVENQKAVVKKLEKKKTAPAESKSESKAVSPEEIKAKNEEKAKAGISYGRKSTTGAEIAAGGGAFTPPAAVPQAEGGQSAGRQLESIAITTTVTGEVDVRFDTNMFQAEVVRILGTSDAKKKYTDLGLIVSEG
jgi:hypothetical protein